MSIAQPYYPPTNGGGFGGEGGSTGSVNDRDYMAGKLLRAIESILFFIVIFQFSTALIALLFTDPIDLDSQSLFARALWYPGYAIVLLLALSNLPKIVRLVAFNPVLVVCILWCGLSYIWSIDPSVTLRRSIALLMTTLFGLVLAARFDWDELIIRIAVVFLSLALISLFLGIFIPDLGKMAAISDVYADSWRGAWIEKNSFGTNMSKGLLIMMCAFAMRPKQWWIWVPGGILCFVLVLLSTSKAALLAALVMILGFLVIRVFRRFPVLRIPLMYGVVLSISVFTFLIIFMPDMMFEIIGKERTLTGRTDIWNSLAAAINERPTLGYGYGTFWMDLNGPSYWVRLHLDWGVPTAHNGWIETWLSAGVVAVILFGILFVLTLLLALDRLYRGGVENYWVILSTVLFFMVSLSESTILQQNDLNWVIFVATSAKLFSFAPAYWRDRPTRPYFQPPEYETQT